jgi:hypothetical protein
MKWRQAFFLFVFANVVASGPGQESKMDADKLLGSLVSSSQPSDVSANTSSRLTAKQLGIDTNEQTRVAKIVFEINSNWSESFWEKLIVMSTDDRHCITVLNDNGFAENWSVGDVCGYYAESQITDSIRECFESISVDVTKEHVGYRVDIFEGQSIASWREQRKGKRYTELQLELVDVAISHVTSDNSVEGTQRELALKGLRNLRRRTERTVQPGFVRVAFIGEEYSLPR